MVRRNIPGTHRRIWVGRWMGDLLVRRAHYTTSNISFPSQIEYWVCRHGAPTVTVGLPSVCAQAPSAPVVSEGLAKAQLARISIGGWDILSNMGDTISSIISRCCTITCSRVSAAFSASRRALSASAASIGQAEQERWMHPKIEGLPRPGHEIYEEEKRLRPRQFGQADVRPNVDLI